MILRRFSLSVVMFVLPQWLAMQSAITEVPSSGGDAHTARELIASYVVIPVETMVDPGR